MKIKKGYTRIVFIFSRVVIKIPYAWHIRYPVLYFLFKKHRQRNEKPTFYTPMDVVRYCLNGWYCNRLEYSYSKKRPNSKGLLHVKSFLWGFFLIQLKREVFNENDPRWKKALKVLWGSGIRDLDALKACNFCIFGNSLEILDYGRSETIAMLENGGLEIIQEIRF